MVRTASSTRSPAGCRCTEGGGPAVAAKRGRLVAGIDDGPFSFDSDRCALACVVMRLGGRVERMLASSAEVDGSDAEGAVAALVASAGRARLAAVMLDGVTFGGMNVVRPAAIFEATGVPVVALSRGEPDIAGMRRVVEEKLGGDPRKLEALDSLEPVTLGVGDLRANLAGIGRGEAAELVRANVAMGATPECLRLADMLASCISAGGADARGCASAETDGPAARRLASPGPAPRLKKRR